MYAQYVQESRNNFTNTILPQTLEQEKFPMMLTNDEILEVVKKRESFRLFEVNNRELTVEQLNKIADHLQQCIDFFGLTNIVRLCFIDHANLLGTSVTVHQYDEAKWIEIRNEIGTGHDEYLYLQKEMHYASGVFYFEWDLQPVSERDILTDYKYILAISGLLGHQASLVVAHLELKGTVFAGITLVEYLEEIVKERTMNTLPVFAYAVQ